MSRQTSLLALLGLSIAGFAGACGDALERPSTAPPARLQAPAFPLSSVVAPAIERLQGALDSESSAPPETANPDRILGLLELLGGPNGRMRAMAREEAAHLGQRCSEQLLALIDDRELEQARRATALELLALVGGDEAAELLLARLESSSEPWLRTHSAWRLGELKRDWVIPRMLLRFKYEKEFETVIWMAKSLASLGNYEGLSALQAVADGTTDPALLASAHERMLEIARQAGHEDASGLWTAWTSGQGELPLPEGVGPARSLRYQLEVWSWIQRFVEYQLRGVDDARFVLQRMGPEAARIMGEALADSNAYIRVGVAQSLQRMGPRAKPAGPMLVAGLADPRLGPWAAEALGAIGAQAFPAGQAALLSCLAEGVDPEIRLSAIRGLGGFGAQPDPASIAALRRILNSASGPGEPTGEAEEFRQAAAESLLALGEERGVLQPLLDWMISERVSPVSSQRALRAWLQTQAEAPEVAALLAGWDALEPPAQKVITPSQRRQAKAAQRELLQAALPGLLAENQAEPHRD